MRRPAPALALLVVALVVTGCGTIPPEPRDIESQFVIEAGFDDVWEGVIETFAERQYPIRLLEKDSGIVVGGDVYVPGLSDPTWCDCGSVNSLFGAVPRSAWKTVDFNVFVRPRAGDVVLNVNARFRGRSGNDLIYCVSTGALERAVAREVAERAGAPEPMPARWHDDARPGKREGRASHAAGAAPQV